MKSPLLLPVLEVMPAPFPFGPPPALEIREWTEDLAMKPLAYVVGVDLGQARDFSTIVISELNWAQRITMQQAKFQPDPGEVKREPVAYHRIRHIERIPLGTSYPAVIDRVAEVMARLPAMPRPAALVVDATGVGRPVLDLMRKSGLKPLGVTITAGSGETVERDDARVAKKILASTMAVVLDTGRLQVIAVGEHVETLRKELRAFRAKVTPNQNESFESWREQDHDDLVLAAALAIWAGERMKQRYKVDPNWILMGT